MHKYLNYELLSENIKMGVDLLGFAERLKEVLARWNSLLGKEVFSMRIRLII